MKKYTFNKIKNIRNPRRIVCLAVLTALLAGNIPTISVCAEEADINITAEENMNYKEEASVSETAEENVVKEKDIGSDADSAQADADSDVVSGAEKSESENNISWEKPDDCENAHKDESEEEKAEDGEELPESDPEADLETADVWSKDILSVEYGGDYRENLIKAAISQLGYMESILNFEIDEDEERNKGYTRYGDWYGDTYGDWCAMFIAFCLHYSGNDIMTADSNCESWKNKLIKEGKYHSARELFDLANPYEPQKGDLIFFDNREDDGKADHIGIVEKIEKGYILTIEGNTGDMVSRRIYSKTDEGILGFGELYGIDSLAEELPDMPELKIEAGSVMLKTDEYFVNISYDDYAGIPEGAEFAVIPVNEDDPAFAEFVSSAKKVFDVPEEEGAALRSKLFRIEIKKDDKIILSKSSVDVKVIFKTPLKYSLEKETYIMRIAASEAEAMETKSSIYGVNKEVQAVDYEADNISSVQGVFYLENADRVQAYEEN